MDDAILIQPIKPNNLRLLFQIIFYTFLFRETNLSFTMSSDYDYNNNTIYYTRNASANNPDRRGERYGTFADAWIIADARDDDPISDSSDSSLTTTSKQKKTNFKKKSNKKIGAQRIRTGLTLKIKKKIFSPT